MTLANACSNRPAKRPVVSQKSSPASTTCWISFAPNTRPDTGTGVSPGTNVRGGKAAAWYSDTRARILPRMASASDACSVTRQELAIPGDGAVESLLEREAWFPAEHRASLGG